VVNEQPEALRLAEVAPYLEGGERGQWIMSAAAELRRLHEINFNLCRKCNTLTILSAKDEDKITALEAINQELLAALKDLLHEADGCINFLTYSKTQEAIAKAETGRNMK
jgi:hypothetical protein